jgi:hypothetical protein
MRKTTKLPVVWAGIDARTVLAFVVTDVDEVIALGRADSESRQPKEREQTDHATMTPRPEVRSKRSSPTDQAGSRHRLPHPGSLW